MSRLPPKWLIPLDGGNADRQHALERLVLAIIARSGCGQVRVPPWELEHALSVAASVDDAAGHVIHAALAPGPLGAHTQGLDRALRHLVEVGLLVYSRHLDACVVDMWSVEELVASWGTLPGSIAAAGEWLAQRDQQVRAASKNRSKS